jgi:hypothetical protein
MTVARTRAVVAACLLLAGLTTGCSGWGCNHGFAADPASDAAGASTPRAALGAWLAGDHEGAPDHGWRRERSGSRGVAFFRNGDWTIYVVEAPAGGYLVNGGGCTTRG